MSTSRTTGGAGTAPEGALRGVDPPERSSVVTFRRLEPLDQGHGAGDHQDATHGLQQPPLGQPAGEPSAEQGAWDRRAGAYAEEPPVDASGRVAHHARDAHPEADRQVRADRARWGLAEPADHRRHAEAAQDQADEAAQQADTEADGDGGGGPALAR